MRRLLLIRHAKSSWKFPDLDDHERPLNKRGERDSLTMARHLADRDEQIDVIYTSTATRALEFAHTISEFSNIPLEPDLSFYTFDPDELLEILRNLPDSVINTAVVAHNPAVRHTIARLTGVKLDKVPTSSVVAMNCDLQNWNELGEFEGRCDLEYFDYPKMLS